MTHLTTLEFDGMLLEASLLNLRGIRHRSQGEYTEAIRCFREAAIIHGKLRRAAVGFSRAHKREEKGLLRDVRETEVMRKKLRSKTPEATK